MRRSFFFLLIILLVSAGLWQGLPRLRSAGRRRSSAPAPLATLAGPAAAPTAVPPPAAARPSEPLPEAFAAFAAWTERYFAARPEDRPALLAEGLALAERRRPHFKQLIVEDPERALAEAVPMVTRQQLPPPIVARLEERVAGRAVLRVYQSTPAPGEPVLPTTRIAEFQNGKTYEAHTFGRRAQKVTWTPNASLHGVAIDRTLALSPEPLRVLEVGEIPDPALPVKAVCPVSGLVTTPLSGSETVSASTPAVEVFGEIVYLCNGSHTTIYRDTLIQAEGGTGGPTSFTGLLPAAPTPSLGQLRILYIPLTFQDQNAVPATEAKCYDVMRDVSDYYAKSSYGRLTTLTTVTPPIRLPHDEAWYVQKDTSNGGDIDGLGLEQTHARDEARRIGFDSNDFDCVVLRLNGGARPTGGWGGGGSVWVYSDSIVVVAHEIGHTFGLAHANFWDTAGTSAIGAGTNAEYGDSFDVMGGGGVPVDQYNAQAKNQIKWLPNDYVQTITQSGQYRLYAYDQPALDPTKAFAMKIVKDAQRTYWGEFRQLYTGNTNRPWADQGMILGWNYPNNNGSNIQLIDTTPGSPYAKDDSPISVGRTFSDFESGIHITTLGVSSTTPKYVDYVVNFGSFPDNHAPTLSLAASAEAVPVGTTVTFTATGADSDGDPLAYSWQHLGDTSVRLVSPNSPVITRTFSTAGSYIVSCTVSDMKGGSCTRWKLITVGNGNSRYTISGRIAVDGVGLANVSVTANGSNGVVTDNDGYYVIPNLTASVYVVTPLLYGYSFTELFNNNLTLGPNYSGANFSAVAAPTVGLVASVPNASESGPVPGKFTLTRTGDTTSALTVNVATAIGSATKGTDYSLSPDYTSGSYYNTFTIPAGQASLDIVVTPVVDATVEGPETVTLQLGPGNGYVLLGNTSATVTIADANSALSKVSLAVTTPSTLESSGSPAVFTLSRTGATTAPLTVYYTVGGTAVAGTHYTTLPGSAVIPAGAGSVAVNVMPLQDTSSGSLKTVTLNLSANAGYLIDSTSLAGSVSIIDDDLQIVNATATDAVATEVDLTVPGAQADTATFLVTRAGDTTLPLTVYYAVSGLNGTGATAIHGVDYEALPGMVLIPAGETSAAVTIIPRYDHLGEGPEKVVFQLGAGPTNYLLGLNNTATITINDAAGDLPTVGVIQMTNAAEPSTSGVFRISARGAGTGTLTVNYSMSGSAVAGTDYNIAGLGSTTITLNNGAEVTKDISVVPVNNSTADPLRTITLTLTPSAGFQTFAPTAAATMWLRDDDQPTVYVDAHQTSTPATISENGAASKFYLSRTGATTSALTVNYTMGGTAVNGTDYSAVSGVATIPVGVSGVDVAITPINNATFSGTRTITLNLAAGSYAAGPSATMYLTDDEVSTQKVGFATRGATGSEAVTSVSIPVNLTTAATAPTTVEYWADTGTRTSTVSAGTLTAPYWVRVVRTGTTFASYFSTDGVTWVARGSTTAAISSANYLAGLAVASSLSGTSCTAVIDHVQITGLDAGGGSGAAVSAGIGTQNPAGSDSQTGGVYTITAGGPDLSGTTDNFRYVYFPVTASANCTLTARIVSLSGGVTASKAGVMIRETTASNSRHVSTVVTQGNVAYEIYRQTAGSSAGNNAGSYNANVIRPYWVRLQRVADQISAFTSPDGANFQQVGFTQSLPMAPQVLAGLAVSARNDGQLNTATFDNVSITGIAPLTLQGRSVGFLNAQGSDSVADGVYTVTGSGVAIGNAEDECHFVAMPASGDFTITARVVSQVAASLVSTNAQAGVMIRETGNYRARSAYMGLSLTGSSEFIYRNSTVNNAQGDGIDHALTNGILTFAPGDQTKNITFSITPDLLTESSESVVISLRNPYNASLDTISQFTYTVADDDSPPPLPYVGFAASASSAAENAGTASVWVTLSTPATGPVQVDYAVTGGTAANGTDYVLSAGTLNFAAGDTALPIQLTLKDDAVINGNRTILLTLSNPVNGALQTQSVHTFTIVDDEQPVVTLVANQPNAAEGGASGQFTFTRTGPLTAALTVGYAITGTATNGTDYNTLATSIVIPVNQSSATLDVVTKQDVLNEGNETVILTLAASGAYNTGAPSAATVTIADDDRPIVNIVATIPTTREGGSPGQFTVTRSGALTSAITVNFSISGTATLGADYTASSSTTLAANQTTAVIPITPIDDQLVEPTETVIYALAAGSYNIGPNAFASVSILDNDVAPTVYISSPAQQGTLVPSGQGLVVTVTATDDGLPQPMTYAWSQVSGPGTATFETPSAPGSPVTFSADGVYVLKVSVSDGQFTVSDQVTVVSGSAIAPADWLAHDLTPLVTQRGQSAVAGGSFALTGGGAGYAGATSDAAQVMVRPASGNSSIVARLTSFSGAAAAPFAGVTMRDTEYRGAKRAVLGFLQGTGLQFRTRSAVGAADTVVASQSGITLPVWLRLDRDATANTITASFAADVSGSPGAWTALGSASTIVMDAVANIGLTSTSNSTTLQTVAVLDNVTPTPAVSAGGALIAEDGGTGNPTAGSATYNNGTWTIAASGSLDTTGYFVGQEYFGDVMITAKLVSASSGALNALSGVMIREGFDQGGYAFLGRIPTSSFNGYIWRSYASGTGGGVPSFTNSTRWIRLIRSGNTITGFHAPDSGGSPGAWVQAGQPLTVIMAVPVFVGLAVDNNGGGTVLNTAVFSNMSIVPLNQAPSIGVGSVASGSFSPLTLAGSVTDDGFPAPATLTSQWLQKSGPGVAAFTNAAQPGTTVSLSQSGPWRLRLQAADSGATTFRDLTFTSQTKPYDSWAAQMFGASWTDASVTAPNLDNDGDGLNNLLEYALGTNPLSSGPAPAVMDTELVDGVPYLRLTVSKNPAATDVTYVVEATGGLGSAASWGSGGLLIEADTPTQTVVRDSVPTTTSEPRFMRLRVQR